MDNERCWRIRFTYLHELTEKWNLTFDDILTHIDSQKAMSHEFIVMEERPGYCRWGLRHPSVGDYAICTVWTDNPADTRSVTAGFKRLATKVPS